MDLGAASYQVKIVGTLTHGSLLVLHVVHPWIKDDSNLSGTVLLDALKRTLDERSSFRGLPAHAPRHARWQLDGVSTNWGKVIFALAMDMCQKFIFENLDIVRNPTGNTHEDIDAIFGVLMAHLLTVEWATVKELIAHMLVALQSISVKTIVVEVTDVLDFKEYYKGTINPHVSGFGPTAARGSPDDKEYQPYIPGYHKLTIKRDPSGGLPAASIRRYVRVHEMHPHIPLFTVPFVPLHAGTSRSTSTLLLSTQLRQRALSLSGRMVCQFRCPRPSNILAP